MKRLITIALLVGVLGTLGCGGTAEKNVSTTVKPKKIEVAKPNEYSPAYILASLPKRENGAEIKFLVLWAPWVKGCPYFTPYSIDSSLLAGRSFQMWFGAHNDWRVNMVIENVSSEPIEIDLNKVSLKIDGRVYIPLKRKVFVLQGRIGNKEGWSIEKNKLVINPGYTVDLWFLIPVAKRPKYPFTKGIDELKIDWLRFSNFKRFRVPSKGNVAAWRKKFVGCAVPFITSQEECKQVKSIEDYYDRLIKRFKLYYPDDKYSDLVNLKVGSEDNGE